MLAICEAILPLDEPRRLTWQTWFAFWGAAVADPELAAMQRRRLLWFRELLARELDGDDEAARELLVLVRGIAAEAVFDPDDWPPERQRELARRTIERLDKEREHELRRRHRGSRYGRPGLRCILADAGKRVAILEKHPYLGGRAMEQRHHGHQIGLSSHLVEDPGDSLTRACELSASS